MKIKFEEINHPTKTVEFENRSELLDYLMEDLFRNNCDEYFGYGNPNPKKMTIDQLADVFLEHHYPPMKRV